MAGRIRRRVAVSASAPPIRLDETYCGGEEPGVQGSAVADSFPAFRSAIDPRGSP
jgi:hypothetical protein